MSLWSRIERRLSGLADELLPDEFRQHLLTARVLLERGQAADAAEALETLLAERPEHAGALALLGAARLELGDLAAAHAAFDRALDVRGDMPEALLGLGQVALALGNLEAAINAFRAAVSAAGGDRNVLGMAYRGLGMAYRRSGDIEKAVRELRKAVAESTSDLLARAALGEALLADPRVSAEEARHHLQRVVDAPAEPGKEAAAALIMASLALGRIALDDEDSETARACFERVLEIAASLGEHATSGLAAALASRQPEHLLAARIGLGDAAMLGGNADEARAHYEQALAASPRNAAAHAHLGDVQRQSGDLAAALASYERALAGGTGVSDVSVLRRALDTAIEANAVDAAERLASDMLALDPTEPRAALARGLGLARQGQHEAARAMFRAALQAGGAIEAHLALGRLELEIDASRAAGVRAAAEALAALRIAPGHTRARALLAEARSRELGEALSTPDATTGAESGAASRASDASDMYQLAGRLQRLALARSELADLGGDAARAAADFDQPLLVTIMGEFSSGKSTFVNAFIGRDVAPTGITPTTATINIVKYGREPGGRISYRDGTIETLGWDALFAALHALDAEQVRRIDLVEILVPMPELEQVNIVDTPGLNSILPEHEEVARGFIARADAVIWLFTAMQAGKASERKALQRIRSEGTRVLGVLNKKDQLNDDEVRQLIDYVQSELSGLVELVVPVSARHALEHRRTARQGNPGPEPASNGNWPVLEAALEERFFARAREIKRDACSRRLALVIERGRGILLPMRQRAEAAAAALSQAAETLSQACPAFIDEVVLRQRTELQDAVAALYRRASREVLELVRPRLLPFGSNSATPADRDYLVSLLDSGYEEALERCRRAVVAMLQAHSITAITAISGVASVLGNDVVGDVARTAADAVRLVEAQVFDATRAYLRGYVRGGYVSNFVRQELPKLELVEDAVYDALLRGAPDLDREIALRLATAGTSAISAMAGRLSHWAGVAEVMAYDLEVGVERALESIDQRRLQLTSTSPPEQNQATEDATHTGNR